MSGCRLVFLFLLSVFFFLFFFFFFFLFFFFLEKKEEEEEEEKRMEDNDDVCYVCCAPDANLQPRDLDSETSTAFNRVPRPVCAPCWEIWQEYKQRRHLNGNNESFFLSINRPAVTAAPRENLPFAPDLVLDVCRCGALTELGYGCTDMQCTRCRNEYMFIGVMCETARDTLELLAVGLGWDDVPLHRRYRTRRSWRLSQLASQVASTMASTPAADCRYGKLAIIAARNGQAAALRRNLDRTDTPKLSLAAVRHVAAIDRIILPKCSHRPLAATEDVCEVVYGSVDSSMDTGTIIPALTKLVSDGMHTLFKNIVDAILARGCTFTELYKCNAYRPTALPSTESRVDTDDAVHIYEFIKSREAGGGGGGGGGVTVKERDRRRFLYLLKESAWLRAPSVYVDMLLADMMSADSVSADSLSLAPRHPCAMTRVLATCVAAFFSTRSDLIFYGTAEEKHAAAEPIYAVMRKHSIPVTPECSPAWIVEHAGNVRIADVPCIKSLPVAEAWAVFIWALRRRQMTTAADIARRRGSELRTFLIAHRSTTCSEWIDVISDIACEWLSGRAVWDVYVDDMQYIMAIDIAPRATLPRIVRAVYASELPTRHICSIFRVLFVRDDLLSDAIVADYTMLFTGLLDFAAPVYDRVIKLYILTIIIPNSFIKNNRLDAAHIAAIPLIRKFAHAHRETPPTATADDADSSSRREQFIATRDNRFICFFAIETSRRPRTRTSTRMRDVLIDTPLNKRIKLISRDGHGDGDGDGYDRGTSSPTVHGHI